MVTSLQVVPITVPRSVVVSPQQTRSPTLRRLDWSPVINMDRNSRMTAYTPHEQSVPFPGLAYQLHEQEVPVERHGYMTNLLGDRAVQTVEGYAKAKEPFLLSLHFTAPHWRWEGPDDEAESKRIRTLLTATARRRPTRDGAKSGRQYRSPAAGARRERFRQQHHCHPH